ncbi:LysR family transcriptional regulator [Hydrogenophaga sp. 2FB]|uniref:LysR family transcriptional regulator n=1 Tax=Hydrogenophaga sp. 2FB TaxID=2502187 RepID=UPI0010F6C4C0|nr:LysR family transcriptional regulator [Hydrogenophaga sp. 2FB]
MNVDLKPIEAFVHVMRSGSLTKAEDVTGISKATLSRHISRLEEDLGSQLLIRSSRRVTPTEAGRAYFLHCENLLSEVSGRMETARTDVQALTSGVSGTLSLLVDSQFGTSFLCHVAKVFLEVHPSLQCQFNIANRHSAPQIQDVDCYVCERPPDLPNLVGKLLGRLTYSLYASPDYLLKHGHPESPDQLAEHSSIVLKDAQDDAEVVLHSGGASRVVRHKESFTTNDHWVMKTFCTDGFGIALFPDFFTRPEVRQGSLVPVLPEWKPEPRRLYCAYQRQRYMGQKVRSFVDLMARCVADIDTFNNWVSMTPVR